MQNKPPRFSVHSLENQRAPQRQQLHEVTLRSHTHTIKLWLQPQILNTNKGRGRATYIKHAHSLQHMHTAKFSHSHLVYSHMILHRVQFCSSVSKFHFYELCLFGYSCLSPHCFTETLRSLRSLRSLGKTSNVCPLGKSILNILYCKEWIYSTKSWALK